MDLTRLPLPPHTNTHIIYIYFNERKCMNYLIIYLINYLNYYISYVKNYL